MEDPRKILSRLQASPKQSLGQNFCVDGNILRKIASYVDAGQDDTIIEIGPGTGALTAQILPFDCELHLIEIDDRLVPTLREVFAENPKVTVHHGDALKLLPEVVRQFPGKAIVTGNLPYQVSSQLLVRMIENQRKIRRCVLTFQLEMAARIAGKPNSKDYGSLSVRAQLAGAVDLLFKIKPNSFFPPPKVMSACLRVDFEKPAQKQPEDDNLFVRVLRAAFAKRRKQIRNALCAEFDVATVDRALSLAGIEAPLRAEQLAPERFVALADAFLNQ